MKNEAKTVFGIFLFIAAIGIAGGYQKTTYPGCDNSMMSRKHPEMAIERDLREGKMGYMVGAFSLLIAMGTLTYHKKINWY